MNAPEPPAWLHKEALCLACALFVIVPLSGLWLWGIQAFFPMESDEIEFAPVVIGSVVCALPIFGMFVCSQTSTWQRHPYQLAFISGVIFPLPLLAVFAFLFLPPGFWLEWLAGAWLYFLTLSTTATLGFTVHYQWLQILLVQEPVCKTIPAARWDTPSGVRGRVKRLRFSLGSLLLVTLLAAVTLGLGRWMELNISTVFSVCLLLPALAVVVLLPLHLHRGLNPAASILPASLLVHSWSFWHWRIATLSSRCIAELRELSLFAHAEWVLSVVGLSLAGTAIALVCGTMVGVLLLPVQWFYRFLEWEMILDDGTPLSPEQPKGPEDDSVASALSKEPWNGSNRDS